MMNGVSNVKVGANQPIETFAVGKSPEQLTKEFRDVQAHLMLQPLLTKLRDNITNTLESTKAKDGKKQFESLQNKEFITICDESGKERHFRLVYKRGNQEIALLPPDKGLSMPEWQSMMNDTQSALDTLKLNQKALGEEKEKLFQQLCKEKNLEMHEQKDKFKKEIEDNTIVTINFYRTGGRVEAYVHGEEKQPEEQLILKENKEQAHKEELAKSQVNSQVKENVSKNEKIESKQEKIKKENILNEMVENSKKRVNKELHDDGNSKSRRLSL